MQSNNPILTRAEVVADYRNPMTVAGATQKALLLTGIATFLGLAFYIYCAMSQSSSVATAGWAIGAIGSFLLALVIMFKSDLAPTLAVPYALFEGVFLGGVSYFFEMRYPGIASQALLATFATAGGLFFLYSKGIIRATEKFKAIVMSATMAIALVFIVQLVMHFVFSSSIPKLFESNALGIGFAAFVAVIASLNLILDFDLIENGAANGAPKAFEWVCAVSLLATLVWMYVSFLRLLGLINADD